MVVENYAAGLVLGLSKPLGGKVLLNGVSMRKWSPGKIAQQVAYVPRYMRKPSLYGWMVLMGRASYIACLILRMRRTSLPKGLAMVGITGLRAIGATPSSAEEKDNWLWWLKPGADASDRDG